MFKNQYRSAGFTLTLLLVGCSDDTITPGEPSAGAPLEAARPALARTASIGRTRVQLSGMGAEAVFNSVDPSGCVETSVNVFGAELAVKEGPGKPVGGPLAEVWVSQFNYCTFEFLQAFGETVDAVFNADRTLNEARLRGTIPAFDSNSNTEVGVEVDLIWTGTGERVSGSERERVRMPGFQATEWFKGVRREAVVAGTVVVGGVDVMPDASEFGEIVRARSGERTVERTR
jgi:hypothetical protein